MSLSVSHFDRIKISRLNNRNNFILTVYLTCVKLICLKLFRTVYTCIHFDSVSSPIIGIGSGDFSKEHREILGEYRGSGGSG